MAVIKQSDWVNMLMEYVWVTNGQLLHNPEKMADIVAKIQNDAISGVEMIRCMKHRETPRLNNCAHGSECGYCAYESGPMVKRCKCGHIWFVHSAGRNKCFECACKKFEME